MSAPCKWCNDEGVVCTHEGDVIGPCDCASEVPSDAQLMTFGDALAASLPSDALTNALLTAGRGHLLG